MQLTNPDFEEILKSLEYSKKAKEEYSGYPSPEFKQRELGKLEDLIAKVKAVKKTQNS